MHEIIADLDEGLRDDIGIERTRRGVRVLVCDTRKILECLGRILFDARAGFVHDAQLPQGYRLASRGCAFECGNQIVAAQLGRIGSIEHLRELLRRIERALRFGGQRGSDRK